MEIPECPICLQSYDEQETIPRVLSCGHSLCHLCITQLPPHFPNTLRCPSCNQLVKNPPQGPSALPKNIDLLRLINTHQPKSPPQSKPRVTTRNPNISKEFLPSFYSEQSYSIWKDFIIQEDAIFDERTIVLNRTFRKNQKVGLLHVGSSSSSSPLSKIGFSLSYTARILEVLNGLRENAKLEMGLLMKASFLQRRLCRIYGLWMNSEGLVFLVFEKCGIDFLKVWNELKHGFFGVGSNSEELIENSKMKDDGITGFAMVGLEFCEVVLGLHSEGIVSGCLGVFCFSFDDLGHFLLDLNSVLLMGRRVWKITRAIAVGRNNVRKTDIFDDLIKSQVFVSPEVFTSLLNEGNCSSSLTKISIGYASDVWSLAFILLTLLLGDSCVQDLFTSYCCLYTTIEEKCDESLFDAYKVWLEKLISAVRSSLREQFEELQNLLYRCFEYDPGNRPQVKEIWRCIRGLLGSYGRVLTDFDLTLPQEDVISCMVHGNLCSSTMDSGYTVKPENGVDMLKNDGISDIISCMNIGETGERDAEKVKLDIVDKEIMDQPRLGDFKTLTLQGHLDCITCLAVGGGFLFSSSFDKTVNVWSLQDFSHLRSLRGHEHKVMAVVAVDASRPLCISGDSGGGIFVWDLSSLGQEPLKKWSEHNDWRYSGVHALTVSGVEYLYSGSGDKLIRAWSLQDYTLTCTMSGHNSVVSSLAICDGVLYSGSWDGTIRLWLLSDHSPLAVLGDGAPGMASVLSLSVDSHILVASYENGCVKIWRHDMLLKSMQIIDGAILALNMKGKFLFMGGWNKTVNVQELIEDGCQIDSRPVGILVCDSVITSLLYFEGKLFVGFSDKVIKVFCHGS